MKQKHSLVISALFLLAGFLPIVYLSLCQGCSGEKKQRVLKVATPMEGLLALPMLRMVETQPLKDQNITVELVPWKNPDQLRAIILSESADLAGMHTISAVVMNSKGVRLQMMGMALGNVLRLLSTDPTIDSLAKLKGKTVAVPFKGGMPDILFRVMLEKTPGIDSSDVNIRYAATPRDAGNLLVGGQVQAAISAFPHAAILIRKAGKNGIPKVYDALDLQTVWDRIHGEPSPMPNAGIAALGAFCNDPGGKKAFWKAYAECLDWCIDHPEAAARLQPAASKSDDVAQGLTRAAKEVYMRPVTAIELKDAIQQMMKPLREVEPGTYADAKPRDGFYWIEGQ